MAAQGGARKVSKRNLAVPESFVLCVCFPSAQHRALSVCRFLRWLCQAEGAAVTMDPPAWERLAGPGSGTQAGLLAAGIQTGKEALAACAALTAAYAASGAHYTLEDLSVFACLTQHRETYAGSNLPDPPPPVTEHADLDVETPDPPDPRVAPARAADPVARRIREKSPGPPRRRPRPATASCISAELACVLPSVLSWAPLRTGWALAQCCRSFHAGGLFMACRAAQRKRNVADSVASLLSFQGPLAAGLFEEGVTQSTLLRMLACSWDWLAKCARGGGGPDEHLLALAIVRISAKLELRQGLSKVAIRLLGRGGDQAALHALECRLVML